MTLSMSTTAIKFLSCLHLEPSFSHTSSFSFSSSSSSNRLPILFLFLPYCIVFRVKVRTFAAINSPLVFQLGSLTLVHSELRAKVASELQAYHVSSFSCSMLTDHAVGVSLFDSGLNRGEWPRQQIDKPCSINLTDVYWRHTHTDRLYHKSQAIIMRGMLTVGERT